MEIITLQINNEKAYKLIEDLEALDIVKVLKKNKPTSKSKVLKPSEYAGIISKKAANFMVMNIEQSRNEWERDF